MCALASSPFARSLACACFVQGNTAFKKGDFAEAIARYKAAYEIEPEMPHYQLNLAAAYLKVQKCVVGLAMALALAQRMLMSCVDVGPVMSRRRRRVTLRWASTRA